MSIINYWDCKFSDYSEYKDDLENFKLYGCKHPNCKNGNCELNNKFVNTKDCCKLLKDKDDNYESGI
jgi:hypothetical protein